MKRYCEKFILNDLKKKMVFIGGPRQVGKTTLSKNLCKNQENNAAICAYFNWDVDEDRRAMLQKKWLPGTPLVIFDELHKYLRWKQWIKGVYDSRTTKQQYLVTGSARLDTYKRGGDSLLGRYHYWRLHPLTIDEIPEDLSPKEALRRLLTIGGFPEPFLENNEQEARRWRRERFDRVLKEDVRDLDHIRNIQLLSVFVDALRSRVGSLLVLSNLARDLEISPNTAKMWLELIAKMYLGFTVYPLSNKVPRAILKPPKIYFFDNADVLNDDGIKLENLVATTLLKRLHFIEDYYGYRCSLNYIRDKDGREVDFTVTINNALEYLIEVKLSDDAISSHLKYYAGKLKPKQTVQIVGDLGRSYSKDGILVVDPISFFTKISLAPWK
ncbi:MAG: AAA family ATPase [Gammaproteobacteria bacterium]|nr:AAA family ATPase [Gammaproteobacteria bacterium]